MEYSPAPHTHRFCSQCAQPTVLRAIGSDPLIRCVCESCKIVHYQNPKIIVGTIPSIDGKILLCKRAIEPRIGFWTLPAGFMELADESTAQGARRETLEESGAKVCITDLFSIAEVSHVHQVHIFYRAEVLDMQTAFGDETEAIQLFAFDDIPWKQIAFQTVEKTLRAFIDDTRTGHYSLHHFNISSSIAGNSRAKE